MDKSELLVTCDKCNGDGHQFVSYPGPMFRAWRDELGITQREVCESVGIADNTQLSRFENGRFQFSEARLRALDRFYRTYESLKASDNPSTTGTKAETSKGTDGRT